MLGTLVALSVAGLLAGPTLGLVATVAARDADGANRRLVNAVAQGLTFGLIPSAVVLRLLPHLVRELGVRAVAFAIVGFALVFLVDRHGHRRPDVGDDGRTRTDRASFAAALVFAALVLHALTDGAALALASGSAETGQAPVQSTRALLGVSMLIHRLPEGIFLTTLFLPRAGWAGTWSRIGVLVAATVVGAYAGHALLGSLAERSVDGLVAVGLGGMVRLATHSHGSPPKSRTERIWASAAFALGIAAPVVSLHWG